MLWLLAMHEQGKLQGQKIAIFEPSAKDTNDRTWCFWAKPTDRIIQSLEQVIDTSWGWMHTPTGRQQLAPYRYYHLRSKALYDYVKSIISGYNDIVWYHAAVEEVAETKHGCTISAAGSYTANIVLDSRINDRQAKIMKDDTTFIWQSFVGYRIQLAKPAFDVDTADLMNFAIPQQEQCQFVYVLPFSEREALVELTRFGKDALTVEDAALLDTFITNRWGNYTIEEDEIGRIPMSIELQTADTAATAHYRPIGSAAGAVKSTTGYAFTAMYAHAQAMASNAVKPLAISRKPRAAFYDRLLLHILRHTPQHGANIFNTLWRRIAPPRVLAFLQEETSLLQELPILASLPPMPFLRALATQYLPKKKVVLQPLPVVIMLALLLLGVQTWSSTAAIVLSQILLAIGLLFPGIPHGALDHVLTLPEQTISKKTLPFIGKYLAIMAGVLGIWMLSPALGLTLFVLYSAWHFGETDFREWRSFTPMPAVWHGLGLLLFILGTHWSEFLPYLQAFGLSPYNLTPAVTDGIPVIGAQLLLIGGTFIKPGHRRDWALTMVVILLGAWLPLLAAFGLYFIGLHSTKGWQHIKQEHKLSTSKMIRLATPFTLLAFVGMGIFSGLLYFLDYTWATGWPVFFAFLAAISAPHIWYMHRFYQQFTSFLWRMQSA